MHREAVGIVAERLEVLVERQRLAAQWPTEKKVAKADFVVTTDGTFEETNRQIDEILKLLPR